MKKGRRRTICSQDLADFLQDNEKDVESVGVQSLGQDGEIHCEVNDENIIPGNNVQVYGERPTEVCKNIQDQTNSTLPLFDGNVEQDKKVPCLSKQPVVSTAEQEIREFCKVGDTAVALFFVYSFLFSCTLFCV